MPLQEVDHFWDWFEPQMEAFGYAAAYLGKPARKDGEWDIKAEHHRHSIVSRHHKVRCLSG